MNISKCLFMYNIYQWLYLDIFSIITVFYDIVIHYILEYLFIHQSPLMSVHRSQVKSIFIYIAEYHRSQIASRGFTISTAYDTICSQTLESDEENLPQKTL